LKLLHQKFQEHKTSDEIKRVLAEGWRRGKKKRVAFPTELIIHKRKKKGGAPRKKRKKETRSQESKYQYGKTIKKGGKKKGRGRERSLLSGLIQNKKKAVGRKGGDKEKKRDLSAR